MKIFYLADPHFGHENEAKRRGYKSADEMDRIIIENWNAVVSPEDHVYILGDVTYRAQKGFDYYLKQLNGHLHLVEGNHDSKSLKNRHFRKYFETIDTMVCMKDGKHNVVLFHYPMAEWPGYYRDAILLFGHIHANENEACHIMKGIKNNYNVGADVIGMTPRTLEQLMRGDY